MTTRTMSGNADGTHGGVRPGGARPDSAWRRVDGAEPGVRPARAPRRPSTARPGGRRSSSPLPAVRPAVGASHVRAASSRGAGAPSSLVVRRRRVAAAVVGVLVAVLVALGSVVVLSGGAQASAVPGPTVVTVVGQGESLQDVARRVVPGGDEREIARQVRDLNDLPTSSVREGRPLVVPTGA